MSTIIFPKKLSNINCKLFRVDPKKKGQTFVTRNPIRIIQSTKIFINNYFLIKYKLFSIYCWLVVYTQPNYPQTMPKDIQTVQTKHKNSLNKVTTHSHRSKVKHKKFVIFSSKECQEFFCSVSLVRHQNSLCTRPKISY